MDGLPGGSAEGPVSIRPLIRCTIRTNDQGREGPSGCFWHENPHGMPRFFLNFALHKFQYRGGFQKYPPQAKKTPFFRQKNDQTPSKTRFYPVFYEWPFWDFSKKCPFFKTEIPLGMLFSKKNRNLGGSKKKFAKKATFSDFYPDSPTVLKKSEKKSVKKRPFFSSVF